jgi:hypothetical protein
VTSDNKVDETGSTLLLKVLLKQRHLQVYSVFVREYNRVAAKIDRELANTGPSKAQFYRWLSGELTKLPYSHHCRVLEATSYPSPAPQFPRQRRHQPSRHRPGSLARAT